MSFEFQPHPIPCRNCGTILQATYQAANNGCCPGCGEMVCYVCGCTEAEPCVVEVANANNTASQVYSCSWADDACSHCIVRAAYEFYQEAIGQPADDPYYMNLGRTVRAVAGLSFGV